MRSWSVTVVPSLLAAALLAAPPAFAQYGAPDGEWHAYAGDNGGTKYSGLDQITADNFSDLERHYSFPPHLHECDDSVVEFRPSEIDFEDGRFFLSFILGGCRR